MKQATLLTYLAQLRRTYGVVLYFQNVPMAHRISRAAWRTRDVTELCKVAAITGSVPDAGIWLHLSTMGALFRARERSRKKRRYGSSQLRAEGKR